MADLPETGLERVDDSAPVRALKAGRHDPMRRRQSKRSGREAGCWTYIPAEILQAAGIDLDGLPPFYRVWAGQGGSALLRFYDEP